MTQYTTSQSADSTVTIETGTIRGTVSDDVLSFKGIPYAAPPLGNLRWRTPQPVTPWSGVRQTTEYGHDCLQNMSAFGGDPRQVTVVGESAGGISVLHLLVWPQARGLFQRAVVMSGGGRSYVVGGKTLNQAQASGSAFARSAGIEGTGAEALAALRAITVDIVNGDMSMEALLTKPDTYAGGPIMDGSIVTVPPGELLRRGQAANVPLLIGTTSDDLPVTHPPSLQDPLSYFGSDEARAKLVYNADENLQPADLYKAVAVDMTAHEPARFVARQMTQRGNRVWLYRFGYVAASLRKQWTGAQHASELPFLFQTLDARYGKDVT